MPSTTESILRKLDDTNQPQVEAGSPPDLARVTNLAQFQGYFLDPRPYLSNAAAWEANWSPAFLGALRKPDDTTGLYGFPTQFTVSGPFINLTLFEQAGVPVPKEYLASNGRLHDKLLKYFK